MNNKTSQKIKTKLGEIALELKLRVTNKVVDDEEIAVWEWLSYDEALEKVESAIAALEKIDSMKAKISQSTEPPSVRGSFTSKLREIMINGEPDMSTNFERLDASTLEKLANSEKSFKDAFDEMLTDEQNQSS